MRNGAWKWVLALTVSSILHAGAALFLLPKPDAVEISGSGSVEIALAGNTFADQIASGEVRDVVEPVSDAAEVKAVEAEVATVEPVEAASLPAARPAEPSEATVAESVEISPVESIETAPPQPETVKPVESALAIAPRPNQAPPTEEPPQEIEPAKPVDADRAEQSEIVQPNSPPESVTALANVPIPTPRPHYEPPPKPKEPRQASQPPKRRTAGANGQNRQNTRRGTSNGAEQAVAARQGTANSRADTSGNAAVSNYPGKIVTKLRRALRYPAEARRERLRGEVHVRFTVTGNGGVGAISIVRSSGSPVLDQAAVETVQRAAPFPAIPAGAGRSSWPFTVPLAFSR